MPGRGFEVKCHDIHYSMTIFLTKQWNVLQGFMEGKSTNWITKKANNESGMAFSSFLVMIISHCLVIFSCMRVIQPLMTITISLSQLFHCLSIINCYYFYILCVKVHLLAAAALTLSNCAVRSQMSIWHEFHNCRYDCICLIYFWCDFCMKFSLHESSPKIFVASRLALIFLEGTQNVSEPSCHIFQYKF